MGMNHTVYVNKRAVMGQGISFQDLNSLLETIEEVEIVEWNAHQGNWYKEVAEQSDEGVSTFIIPSVWALTAPESFPEEFMNVLGGGKVRVVYFNKKLDAPNYSFPCLSIPSDRGSLIIEAMVNMMGDSSDRGLHSLFPEGTEVLSHQNITGMETLSFDLEQLFKEFLKKVKKLILHKVKVSIAIKSLIRWVYDSEPSRPEKIEINLGFANNLFGFSCRWKTSFPSFNSLVEENSSLKGIASSTSSLWFNFFPKRKEIEAFGLISFAMDAQNSFPQITNAYSLGLKIFPVEGDLVNNQIKTFGISDSKNLILKKYVGIEGKKEVELKAPPEEVEVITGVGHGVYVVKSAISGHGVTLKDLNSIIEASAGVKIQNWDATQENWMSQAVSLVGNEIVTLFIPSFWLLESSKSSDVFLKHIREGKLRISCLQKKGEPPHYDFPILTVPSDRGSLILEGMAPLVGQAHYSGIRAIFPINTEIVSMAKTSELDRASKNLDKLYDQLMKKARKLMLHKTKVAVAAKTIVYSISVLEEVAPKTVEMQMGYANNLFALSFKWKTSQNSVLDWSKEIPVWKKICSSTSGSWFNFFPESSEIEAVILYSFAIDGENSIPAIDNAYSLGVDIFPASRLEGQDKVEEKETVQDIKVSKTTERALPANFDKEVVNLYFTEEEIAIEEISISDEEVEIGLDAGEEDLLDEMSELSKKVHTILYIKKVFDSPPFDEDQLTEILVKCANYNEVRCWDVQQINWLSELGRMKMHGVFTVLVPPMWLLELPYPLPGNFSKRVLRGELRIVSFNKKLDPPNRFIPGLFVPLDRGETVFKTFLNLLSRPFYCGIHSIFPSGQKLYTATLDLDDKDGTKEGLDEIFELVQKNGQGSSIQDFKLKVNLAIKSIFNFVKKESKKESKDIRLEIGSFENILAFSIKWHTGLLEPKTWIQDEVSWKNISSTSSGFWFNFLPEVEEIEALSIYILDDVDKVSTPSMANAYPMAFEIYNKFRKDTSLRLEEMEIDDESICRLLQGFYDSEGDSLSDEDISFSDEELEIGDSFEETSLFTPQVNKEELSLGEEGIIGEVSIGEEGPAQESSIIGEADSSDFSGSNGIQKTASPMTRKAGKKVAKRTAKKSPKNLRDFSIPLNKNKSEDIKPDHTYMGSSPLAVLFAVKDKRTADKLSKKFNDEKIKVFSTSQSHQAVKFLQNQRFHCLITHMDIAKGHGELVVKGVREDRNNQNYRIPIIVILNDYETKGLLNRIQPLINQILDEDASGDEVYSWFAKLCHPYFLPKKKPN